MDGRELETYNRLRNHLGVDLLNIDHDIVTLAQFQMEASEMASDAATAASEADTLLNAVMAHEMSRLKNVPTPDGKKTTDTQLKADVLLEKDVMDAQNTAILAENDKNKWRGLVDAFKTKSSMIKVSAELITSGYITPGAIATKAREQRPVKQK
jgi:hypothetical protein